MAKRSGRQKSSNKGKTLIIHAKESPRMFLDSLKISLDQIVFLCLKASENRGIFGCPFLFSVISEADLHR